MCGWLRGVFLLPTLVERGRSKNLLIYERGIYVGTARVGSACGFLEGRANAASRERMTYYDLFKDDEWLEQQADYLIRLSDNQGEVLACQEALLEFGKFSEKGAFLVLNRHTLSFSSLGDKIRDKRNIRIRLDLAGRKGEKLRLTWKKNESISIFTGKRIDEDQLFSLLDLSGEIQLTYSKGTPSDVMVSDISAQKDRGPGAMLLAAVLDLMGEKVSVQCSVFERAGLEGSAIIQFSRS